MALVIFDLKTGSSPSCAGFGSVMTDSARAFSRFLSDERLLSYCRVDHYRGSGPGGQKRNKTSNAVRLVHEVSGLIVTASEDRSTQVNSIHALRRLRVKLAAEIREPIDLTRFSPPDWFLELRRDHRIAVSYRHPHYAAVGGLVLDLLAALEGNPAAASHNLGVSTTAVLKVLESESAWWAAANSIRKRAGLVALTARR